MKNAGRAFSRRPVSPATVVGILFVIAGVTMMAACGGSSGGTTTTTTTSPQASLSVTSLTFSTAVGATSAAQTVTVSDTGTATLTFSGISVGSPANANFTPSTTTCTASGIGSGGACTISVTFTSASAGTITGTLTITDNAGTQQVSLSGTAATPTVTVTPPTLTFAAQGVGTSSASQAVTVMNTGTVPVTISSIVPAGDFSVTSNTCPASTSTLATSSSCTIGVTFTPTATGTRTGTLMVTDNASGSPQAVTLTGTGTGTSLSLSSNSLTFTSVTVGSSAPTQPVTLTNNGTTIITSLTAAISAGASDYSISANTCGTSLALAGTCAVTITFTPSTTGTRTGTLTFTDSVGTQNVSLTGTGFSNTVPVTIGFGPNGWNAPSASSAPYYNGIFTTVTVCQPGSTTNCATIPNVLVDTGSYGLRVLSNLLVNSSGTSFSLPQVTDPSSVLPIYECVEYGDLTYTWGPVQLATVQVGGETASQLPAASGGTANAGIPIQVIAANTTPPEVIYYGPNASYQQNYNPCLINPITGNPDTAAQYNDDTVATLGANGILGVGNQAQDCGINCTTLTNTYNYTNGPYMICSAAVCGIQAVAQSNQVWNPVAAFPTDNNGESIQLPSIPATGAAPNPSTITGTMTFGIGTETNNAITSQTIYEANCEADLNEVTFNTIPYFDVANNNQSNCATANASFIDSGSNALYILDPATLQTATGITTVNCTDNGWYCPQSTLNLTGNLAFTIYGENSTQGTVSLSIANADSLFSGNENAAFSNLGGSSIATGQSSSFDSFDFGLPFFYNRTVFVGIAGTSASYPNGYWAF